MNKKNRINSLPLLCPKCYHIPRITLLSKILTINIKCECGYTQDKTINDYLFEMKQIENTNNMNDIKIKTSQCLLDPEEENICYCLNCKKTGCELCKNNEHEDHDVIYTNKLLDIEEVYSKINKIFSSIYKYYESIYNIIQNKTKEIIKAYNKGIYIHQTLRYFIIQLLNQQIDYSDNYYCITNITENIDKIYFEHNKDIDNILSNNQISVLSMHFIKAYFNSNYFIIKKNTPKEFLDKITFCSSKKIELLYNIVILKEKMLLVQGLKEVFIFTYDFTLIAKYQFDFIYKIESQLSNGLLFSHTFSNNRATILLFEIAENSINLVKTIIGVHEDWISKYLEVSHNRLVTVSPSNSFFGNLSTLNIWNINPPYNLVFSLDNDFEPYNGLFHTKEQLIIILKKKIEILCLNSYTIQTTIRLEDEITNECGIYQRNKNELVIIDSINIFLFNIRNWKIQLIYCFEHSLYFESPFLLYNLFLFEGNMNSNCENQCYCFNCDTLSFSNIDTIKEYKAINEHLLYYKNDNTIFIYKC